MTVERVAHIDDILAQELKAAVRDNHVTCAVAWEIAGRHKVSKQHVGDILNQLRIRITDCQLGCFVVKKALHDDLFGKQVDQSVAERVESSLIKGCLPCAVTFKVAGDLGITPKEVGDAATLMRVHISRCQLGCFP
ncbi:MAG: hypothetical protein HY670_12230 [Chloroflexi bacterium]|nr:hypothetical protein [Chloroflexota bacterium]